MIGTANEWTLDGFVGHFDFVHHKMLDHKFVWVLGAGASHASGIPLGSHLVDRWLTEMHLKEDGSKTSLEEWATAERLGISGFNYEDRASFYPKIYHRRFLQYPEEGYAYLESVMSGKDPSPGYSILGSALATDPPRHNVVITTNFDNLVADALSIYTDTFPFVAGHESLTGFVRVSMRRPLICKIHRDLLLGPQSDPRSLRRLHDAWGIALRALFQHYTPLFIGYGGNDDTLMDLLESLQPSDIKGQMIWCYYEKSKPSDRIGSVVGDLNGVLVAVPDFDLLMVLLGEKMGISTLDEEIGERAEERTERYRARIQRLDTVNYPSVAEALAATLERSGGWWAWYQKANLESDPARRETVFYQGIQHCPQSGALHGNFANFLTDVRGNHDEAERFYRKAIELEPKDADIIGNFAAFMSDIRGDEDEADRLYQKALALDPKNLVHTANYAEFALKLGRFDVARQKLKQSKLLNAEGKNELAAVLAFYSAVLARATHEDEAPAIEELRALLSVGFKRSGWNFDELLAFIREKLSTKDHALFSALGAAVLDPTKMPDIEALLKGALKASSGNGTVKRKAVSDRRKTNGHKRLRPARSQRARQRK